MFPREKNKMFLSAAVAATLLAAATAASGAALPGGLSATIEAGWHTKYITQARDNLEKGGVSTAELTIESETGLYAGAWAAFGDRKRYQETNLYAGIGHQWGDFHIDLSYVWLHFHPTEGHGEKDDNELLLAVTWEGLDWMTASAEWLMSTDAEQAKGGGSGSQLLMTLSGENAIEAGPVGLSPYVSVALDYGYSTPEHDGMDYVEFGVHGGMPLSDSAELGFYISQSFRGEDIKKQRREERILGDETWAGISIAFDL